MNKRKEKEQEIIISLWNNIEADDTEDRGHSTNIQFLLFIGRSYEV